MKYVRLVLTNFVYFHKPHSSKWNTTKAPACRSWSFSQRRPTQRGNHIHGSSSMFDTQKIGALTNSVLTHICNSNRGYRNEDASRAGIRQTGIDIVDSAPLLIVHWHDFWIYFGTMTRLCSNISAYTGPRESEHIWQGHKIVVLDSSGEVFVQQGKHLAAYGNSVVHSEHNSRVSY